MRKWLFEIRTKNKMTQQEVANRLGVTRQYFGFIENGERQEDMSFSMMNGLSKIFNLKIEELAAMEARWKHKQEGVLK